MVKKIMKENLAKNLPWNSLFQISLRAVFFMILILSWIVFCQLQLMKFLDEIGGDL